MFWTKYKLSEVNIYIKDNIFTIAYIAKYFSFKVEKITLKG